VKTDLFESGKKKPMDRYGHGGKKKNKSPRLLEKKTDSEMPSIEGHVVGRKGGNNPFSWNEKRERGKSVKIGFFPKAPHGGRERRFTCHTGTE